MLLLMNIQLSKNQGKTYEKEHETPRGAKGPKPIGNEEEEQMHEDHNMIETQRPEEFPSDMISHKRRPT